MSIAKGNLDIIKKHSDDWHMIFKKTLNSAVLYTNDGIFLLRDFKLENNKLFYNNIMSSVNTELYNKLKDTDFIEIIDKNKIKIINEELKDVGIMLFT